jgi:hypothetical protein
MSRRGGATIPGVARAWRALENDQRLAAMGALGLLASMFLPWYEKSFFVEVSGSLQAAKDSVTAFGAFSFVEVAVLLVAAALLVLLHARAEQRAFHLPFGDGAIIMAAGAWAALLIFIRFFDKPDVTAPGRAAATVGIQWGMFVALAAAAVVAYAGWRIRAAGRPEPSLRGWTEEAAALEFEPAPVTQRIDRSAAVTKPLARVPEVQAPPEFGKREPEPEPEPPAPTPSPPARTPRRPRAPRPSGDEPDRLF